MITLRQLRDICVCSYCWLRLKDGRLLASANYTHGQDDIETKLKLPSRGLGIMPSPHTSCLWAPATSFLAYFPQFPSFIDGNTSLTEQHNPST